MCVSLQTARLDQSVTFGPEAFSTMWCFFRPSCFSTKHRLQEFGIGRSPTHRVVFRSFPFLLCKLSKQTNKHFTFLPSCFHVALYSTLVAHRLIFVRFLCSKFSPIPRICSQLDRLEIALNRFSLSRLAIWNALSQKIFVRRVQCKLSMTYCKSFPNLPFSRKKGGWNRKVCTKGRILDNSSCWLRHRSSKVRWWSKTRNSRETYSMYGKVSIQKTI